jgi:hypothetical protein
LPFGSVSAGLDWAGLDWLELGLIRAVCVCFGQVRLDKAIGKGKLGQSLNGPPRMWPNLSYHVSFGFNSLLLKVFASDSPKLWPKLSSQARLGLNILPTKVSFSRRCQNMAQLEFWC